jgi:hypothetical protein
MTIVQLETARALLLEEIDDRDRRVEIHEKCIEPYDANVRSLEAALRAGRMTQAEFEDRRHVSAWCSTRKAFEMVINSKVVNIELEKVWAGVWIAKDPELPRIRESLEKNLEDKLKTLLGI